MADRHIRDRIDLHAGPSLRRCRSRAETVL